MPISYSSITKVWIFEMITGWLKKTGCLIPRCLMVLSMISLATETSAENPDMGVAPIIFEQIASDLQCSVALGKHFRLCSSFSEDYWIDTYGASFWENGAILIGRVDLDGDSIFDYVIRFEHTDYCGTSGCAIRFLFSDQLPAAGWPGFQINSHTPITIEQTESGLLLRFGRAQKNFSAEEIKSRTISSKISEF